jgi:NDP-sugar pyrophosphorylase family protein
MIDENPLGTPLACIEILGRSVIDRTIEQFQRAEAEVISVLVLAKAFPGKPYSIAFPNVDCQVITDVRAAIAGKLAHYSQIGIEHSFVVSANVYSETDVLDLFYFHREGRRTATRARDCTDPLDLWIVDCAKAQKFGLDSALACAETTGAYFVRQYVNRLNHPRDLRRMASDSLSGRCVTRPRGQEVRPGIWIDDGAEIHRRARIVAPAYIGRGSTLREDTLITRCSNIEQGCYIDYGTVIEDSSILKRTHVGIWLDVSRSVVDGNTLVSLKRDAILEISDPGVIRSALPSEAKAGLDPNVHEAAVGDVPREIQREELPAQTYSLEPI